VHLAQDRVSGKQVALKVVFLNRAGLTGEQVRACRRDAAGARPCAAAVQLTAPGGALDACAACHTLHRSLGVQRKILAGEARLVRMVAHPHIVRCLQVLETRRQQVRAASLCRHGMLLQLQLAGVGRRWHSVTRHPACAQVLVLEHLSGGEMLRQLQHMRRYNEATACGLFQQVASAVAYLHSLNILHRCAVVAAQRAV
jgi:serine/threonine protein kinase